MEKLLLLMGLLSLSLLGLADTPLLERQKISPDIWTSLDYFKKGTKVLRLGEEIKRELVGKVISCSGDCELYRKNVSGRLLEGMDILEGDEIKTFDDTHLWLATYSGDLLRVYPNSLIAFNEMNKKKNHVFSFIRLGFGGLTRLHREKSRTSFYSGFDSDMVTLPLKWAKANISYWYRGKKRTRFDRFRYLADLKQKNKDSYKSEIFLVTPNASFELPHDGDFHLFHSLSGKSYLWSPEKEVSILLRAFGKEAEKMPSKTWYVVDEKGDSLTTWKPKAVYQARFKRQFDKLASQQIARELALKKIWQKEKKGVLTYQNWQEADYKRRKDFLKNYTQRVERSFISSRNKISFKNKKNFLLKDVLDSFQVSNPDFDLSHAKFQEKIKKMSDIEYKAWLSKRVDGR